MQAPHGRTSENNTLTRTIICDDFLHAIDIINTIALLAQQMQHHPDIRLANYNQLTITLTTHDAGNTITNKDSELAQKISTVLV